MEFCLAGFLGKKSLMIKVVVKPIFLGGNFFCKNASPNPGSCGTVTAKAAIAAGWSCAPGNCSFRSDLGMSGMIEPDDAVKLLELILAQGFLTDPNMAGVEKMTPTRWQWRCHMLPPFSAGYAKGWKRAVMLLITTCSCYRYRQLLMMMSKPKEPWSTRHDWAMTDTYNDRGLEDDIPASSQGIGKTSQVIPAGSIPEHQRWLR